MFGKKSNNKFHDHIDTLVGANTHIKRDINFSGGIRIDGHVTGNITATDDEHSTLVLSDEGSVEGKIKVANVIINGAVKGPIHSSEYLDLQVKARIYGDIHYTALEMRLGATIDGKLFHEDKLPSDNRHEKVITLIQPEPEVPDQPQQEIRSHLNMD